MKLLKILSAFAFLLVGALVAVATDNVLAGVATLPVVSAGFQIVTGISVFEADSSAAYLTLASIPRTAQNVPNPGGNNKLYLIAVDQITGEWPKRSLITAGEIATAPTLITGTPTPTFVEVAISDNSLKIDESLKGAVGYQSWEQGLELKIAGFTKEQCDAIDKLLNTEVIAVVRSNDGKRIVLGSSYQGLQFEVMHTSGAKGSDRREWTLKAKQDGYMFGYCLIADTVTIPGVAA